MKLYSIKESVLFCENCGNRLEPNSLFCDACGHKIEIEEEKKSGSSRSASKASTDQNFNVFKGKTWQNDLKNLLAERRDQSFGILLTNTTDCPNTSLEDFEYSLSEYIAYRAECHVCYCVLDMATQCVKHKPFSGDVSQVDFVVKTLKEICDVALPEYLLIVGDRKAIQSIKWENALFDPSGHNDSDRYVDSDLPYIVLDTRSPFDGAASTPKLAVGRIPADPCTGFDEACRYMLNTVGLEQRDSFTKALALTAKEWAAVSHLNFDYLSPDFYECPSHSFLPVEALSVIPSNGDRNLFCFNLHGSGQHDYWINGDGIPAFAPQCLPSENYWGYVLATEACYGAKPIIRQGNAQSVLMTAVQNGCIGYVGSTQIAYGIGNVHLELGFSPCAADILVGHFSKYIAQNYRTGDAYNMALRDLLACERDGENVKTTMSFALYGDPTAQLLYSTAAKTSFSKESGSMLSGLRLEMPDVSRAVKLKLTKVSKQISDSASDFVKLHQTRFADTTPKYYTVSGYKGYKASYAKAHNDRVDLLNIYLDDKGKIDRVYISK